MLRYYITRAKQMDVMSAFLNLNYEFTMNGEPLPDDDLDYALNNEPDGLRAYLLPDSVVLLEELPWEKREALQVLGLWPESEQ